MPKSFNEIENNNDNTSLMSHLLIITLIPIPQDKIKIKKIELLIGKLTLKANMKIFNEWEIIGELFSYLNFLNPQKKKKFEKKNFEKKF